ncbi:hypothetical protein CH352_18770 [Leptospira hartskeerlii]|uniref:PIN like domain-containing protein n=1 Tax=Leptospira hartskeerlii TaxID=2023177 RepID=A0A2M9X867_9LEPT|nr:PIN-like domain-containing protein [Leptospira hartskeerlii]PJZ23891.1 hypothetical protein CH357_18825 [Leptospira hartskeerlii]PJZ31929.1 hypothetical protein CH352_18770 [Leptospira hartskeerlii]
MKQTFLQLLGKSNIIDYKKSLDQYFNRIDNVLSNTVDFPIILDANVLLQMYRLSFKARSKLSSFIKDNSKRIFITKQIQKEFLRNREEVVDYFYLEGTNSLIDNFQKNCINSVKSFLNENKTILIDYEDIEKKIKKLSKDFEAIVPSLQEKVSETVKKHKAAKHQDEYLTIYSSLSIIDVLKEDDVKVVKDEFDSLKKDLKDDAHVSKELNKSKSYYIFPGMGDILKKPDDPYGDFIIFHEVLEFMRNEATDAIFLTYDSSKGDWLKQSKEPHLHYIESVFLATSKSLYILDAERYFEGLLDISFKSVPVSAAFSYGEEFEILTNQYVLLWIKLEKLLRDYAEKNNLFQGAVFPIERAIRVLLDTGIVDLRSYNELRELYLIRGHIAHGNYGRVVRLTEERIVECIDRVNYYIATFEKL